MKHTFHRDTSADQFADIRKKVTYVIEADTREDAAKEFEVRWQALGDGQPSSSVVFKERTVQEIQRDCMSPLALAVKRGTSGILRPAFTAVGEGI